MTDKVNALESASILEIMCKYAESDGDSLFAVDASGEHTYSKVREESIKLSKVLKDNNINRNDYVLVECTQDARFLICDFACNIIGAVFVPIEHKASEDRINDITEDTGAKIYIDESKMAELFEQASLVNISEADYAIDYPCKNDVAEILYTTGTTGKSKGIVITHANNIALAENIAYGTQMKRYNVELLPLPISHSHGLRCCYANIFNCGCLVLTDGIGKIKYIYDLIKEYKVTAIDASPAAMTFLMKLSKGKFSEFNDQLDYIQIGTAMLSEELKAILKEQFKDVRLYNFYGSTESGRSCVLNFNSSDDMKFCIGKPTKNAEFIVTDSDRNIIKSSKDNTGLLACKGPMNMKEYLGQPKLTASVYRDGYIFSSDEAYIDERGYVFVLGRADDVINFKGIKISPGEIEDIAIKFKGIEDCACVPIADKAAGQIPKLFVKVNSKYDRTEYLEYLKTHIDANKLPKELAEIDEIPRTYNGKIKRKELSML